MTVNPQNLFPYLGVRAKTPPDLIKQTRNPTTSDYQFQIGTLWVNTTGVDSFQLVGISGQTATWVSLGGGTTQIATLTGDTGGAISPTAGNINILGGTGASVAGSGSTLTVNVVGGGMKTTVVTANTPMAVNTAYVANKAGTAAVMTLPAVAAVGDVVRVSGLGATSYSIAQNAGQSIHLDATTSTVGVGGSVTPTSRYQSMEILCIVANTEWTILYTSDAVTIV